MKSITSGVAAVSLLFAALAAGVMAFTSTRSAISWSDSSTPQAPSGVIETDGTLDTTFNPGSFTNGLVLASTYQSDGKLLIAGQFNRVHNVSRAGLARLNADGTLDTSFDPGTGSDSGVGGVAVQTDGKILIWSFFRIFNGDVGLASLARLNSDGSVDSSFHVGHDIGGTAFFSGVYSVVLQPDGKIVVAGNFTSISTPSGPVARSCVARFNSDGTLDATFDPGAGAVSSQGQDSDFVFIAASQSVGQNAGKIIIQGSFNSFDNHPALGMARLNPDGSFDSTFDPGTATGGFQNVFGILVQPDDRPVVYGIFDSFNGTACSDIVRLNSDGSVDTGFHTATFSRYGNKAIVFGLARQSNGQFIVGGDFHSLGGVTINNVARLNSDGSHDTTFSAAGGGSSAENVNTVSIRSGDGKVFLGGNFSTYGGEVRHDVALTNTDGTADNTFAGLAGATDYNPNIWTMVVQPDGKILITGYFNSVKEVPHYNVVRLNPDATIDSSFNVNTDRSTRGLLLQPDGKVVVAGDFGQVNGVLRNRIARVNPDGMVDLTFDPGSGADRIIRALAQDSAGNIYAGGDFSSFNGIPRRGIVKLTPTGAVDSAFNPSGGGVSPANIVNAVTAMIPPDSGGHIVIGGSFSSYNGTSARRIARINTATGAIDSTFQPGSGFDQTVLALQAAPDGKYYAGGNFTLFNNVPRRLVARLNNNGTLDTDFQGPYLEGIIYSLALQNGKVYAAGHDIPPFFDRENIMVRLTSSGAVDPSFNIGKGFEISPEFGFGQALANETAMVIQADGKLLVGGIFNQYNGTQRVCLARLTGPVVVPTPTPTPTPTATPALTATPTASPTATPTATPAVLLGNISTRGRVGTGNDVLIAGFIITGNAAKQVTVRGIGPSLSAFGVSSPLADPVLELHGPSGFVTVMNDNWRDSQTQCLETPGLRPTNDLESAICGYSLNPGAYTAILKGKNNGVGVGLVEVYDVSPASDSKLANVSTRGLVFLNSAENSLIAGTILLGQGSQQVLVRGIGPSLNLPFRLGNPLIRLVDANGAVLRENNDWRDDQEAAISATGLAPTNDQESAILETLPANGAAYTVILTDGNPVLPPIGPQPPLLGGAALVEIYRLP